MAEDPKEAFKKVGLGSANSAYDIIAKLDPEYFDKLKGLYIDGTFYGLANVDTLGGQCVGELGMAAAQ